MINARSETVATSPAFAASFERRRCLVPADGWYEWVRTGKQRQAYYMTPLDSSVLAFAGIWTMWRGDTLTCSVLTTAALGGLKAQRGVQDELIKLKELEDEGDRVVRDAIADLFRDERIDPLTVIRWKDIFEALEDALDACETAANVVGNVVVKNA